MIPPVPDWLADPGLRPLWDAARGRLERGGLRATGRVRLTGLDRAKRHALSGLLGRAVVSETCTVDLAVLDAVLHARSGVGGLPEVVSAVTGMPLRDRARERDLAARRRAEPLELARTLLSGPWVDAWAESLRSTGLLTGRADALPTVEAAARMLGRLLPQDGRRPAETVRSRVDLAAETTGDAHALDEDRLLHAVVLRALCAASGSAWPTTTSGRRAVWEGFGIHVDLVSSTCLTLGLRIGGAHEQPPRPAGMTELAQRLDLAADAGAPVHLTAWDLRSWPPLAPAAAQSRPSSGAPSRPSSGAPSWAAGMPVLVCENPRVLEAVATRYGGAVPVVCTSGEPNTVVTAVLDRLHCAGLRLLSHGDFDWPGVAIVNRLVHRLGVEPWLMDAVSYQRGAGDRGPELVGTPVAASWEPALAPAMVEVGRAVHEEAVLPFLLDALGSWPRSHRGPR
ncbi:MAG TPA: TIGR02679 domain-containing protein [Dermatophilaceae bacterium]|nr:TIGR02679 domain-containing protein [Dermatophilaceae bacterium]